MAEHDAVECNVGWKKLYQPLLDLCALKGIKVVQVKEKFGTMRFYTEGYSEELSAIISAAEAASRHTCEDCGEDGIEGFPTPHVFGQPPIYKAKTGGTGWIRTLCTPCREIWEKRRT